MTPTHLAYLRTMAAYAVDPYAPQVCRDAKAELERIESAAAAGGSQPVDASSSALAGPGIVGEISAERAAADPQPDIFGAQE